MRERIEKARTARTLLWERIGKKRSHGRREQRMTGCAEHEIERTRPGNHFTVIAADTISFKRESAIAARSVPVRGTASAEFVCILALVASATIRVAKRTSVVSLPGTTSLLRRAPPE